MAQPAKPVSETSLGSRMILALALRDVIDGLLLDFTAHRFEPRATGVRGGRAANGVLLLHAVFHRLRLRSIVRSTDTVARAGRTQSKLFRLREA